MMKLPGLFANNDETNGMKPIEWFEEQVNIIASTIPHYWKVYFDATNDEHKDELVDTKSKFVSDILRHVKIHPVAALQRWGNTFLAPNNHRDYNTLLEASH